MTFLSNILKRMRLQRRLSSPRANGFSLIESVVALGIMGLAVTALLGLLPHGMEVSRRAANAGATARIIESVTNELSQLNFTNLQDLPALQRLVFDDEGMLLFPGQTSGQIAYVAEVEKPNDSQGKATLPGGGPDEYLLRFIVKVANTPLPDFNFEDADPSAYYTTPVFLGPSIQQ
ncbi:MAG: Verru_Chthon cassette protein B [Verrucomicrobiaceae bacterium]|nr:Verru_Chthon cassette protein B [Verrucomicrobiaceae bacterium]